MKFIVVITGDSGASKDAVIKSAQEEISKILAECPDAQISFVNLISTLPSYYDKILTESWPEIIEAYPTPPIDILRLNAGQLQGNKGPGVGVHDKRLNYLMAQQQAGNSARLVLFISDSAKKMNTMISRFYLDHHIKQFPVVEKRFSLSQKAEELLDKTHERAAQRQVVAPAKPDDGAFFNYLINRWGVNDTTKRVCEMLGMELVINVRPKK